MEVNEQSVWKIPLLSQPEIVSVSYSPIGVRRREEYSHDMACWQIGFFDGPTSVTLTHGSSSWQFDIGAETVFVIPPNSHRSYVTPRKLYHYTMPFRFAAGQDESGSLELPAIIDPGPAAGEIRRELATIADLRDSDRFESDLQAWLLLCRLVRLARITSRAEHDAVAAVQAALLSVRENMADTSLTPGSLARAVGFSRRRLDQLFVMQTGKPIGAWIRERRRQLAVELLCQTALPIQDVGKEIGISDPHAFNKFIRRECGHSPTAIRSSGTGRSPSGV
jgi:AraC-like DNA-binding protein